MDDQEISRPYDRRVLALKAVLLGVWASVSFGVCFFARELNFTIGAWPFSYWFAAQGAMLAFIAIVVVYAWAMARLAPDEPAPPGEEVG